MSDEKPPRVFVLMEMAWYLALCQREGERVGRRLDDVGETLIGNAVREHAHVAGILLDKLEALTRRREGGR